MTAAAPRPGSPRAAATLGPGSPPTAAALIPPRATLPQLREIAAGCRACDLWERATQTVFGAGDPHSPLVLVGEQPGDQEDRAGLPFVGPAGQLLDRALTAAGIDRERAFVTNVVKHFKWKPAPGGKRRLHERPSQGEVRACVPWLEAELSLIRPEALVLLGATAAQVLLGSAFKLTAHRGELIDSPLAPLVVATIHPSAILRSRSEADRSGEMTAFVADLSSVAAELAERGVDVGPASD